MGIKKEKMNVRFKETSDLDLIMMIHECEKAGHPEDKEFIREAQIELRERQRAFYRKEFTNDRMAQCSSKLSEL